MADIDTKTRRTYEMWLTYWLDDHLSMADIATKYGYANRSSISRRFREAGLPSRTYFIHPDERD